MPYTEAYKEHIMYTFNGFYKTVIRFKRLYEDSVTGSISDERFTELSADYEAEQKELKELPDA